MAHAAVEPPKYIDGFRIKQFLKYEDLIPVIEEALLNFSARESGGIVQPVRSSVAVEDRGYACNYLFVLTSEVIVGYVSVYINASTIFQKSFVKNLTQRIPGGTRHRKGVGMLVVSLRGVNFGFWSHLGCSGQNATKFSREGLV